MSQNIKAKETYYDGYRFRSRLEARWAVVIYNKKSRAKYTGLNLVHLQGLEPRTH